MGRRFVFKRSATPPPQWAGSQHFPILGVLSIYAYTICRRTSNFGVVTYVGVVPISWSQPRLAPKRAEIQHCSVLGVLLYLSIQCIHRLTQRDQSRHGNTYGKWRVAGGQPRHCVCANASRGLSAKTEFLVELFWCRQSDKHTNITSLAEVMIMTATWVMLVRCNYTVFRTIFRCTWVKLLSGAEYWLSRCTRPSGNRGRSLVTHYFFYWRSTNSLLAKFVSVRMTRYGVACVTQVAAGCHLWRWTRLVVCCTSQTQVAALSASCPLMVPAAVHTCWFSVPMTIQKPSPSTP